MRVVQRCTEPVQFTQDTHHFPRMLLFKLQVELTDRKWHHFICSGAGSICAGARGTAGGAILRRAGLACARPRCRRGFRCVLQGKQALQIMGCMQLRGHVPRREDETG